MASGVQQKMDGQNLREQLASAVRSIQWSYAIFWSPSSSEPGALEWGEGYYNGDIKTRKTVLAMEMNNDQMGCQRSDQLRELYESLLSGAGDDPSRRPSAALSPEDLTNAEWYYLVCMSFIFAVNQGLPGRALGNGHPIWLSNAYCADTSIFCRSLLAKSANIKTLVCFPFLNGVIELGTTDLVEEDLDLIRNVKTTFLEINSYPSLSQTLLDYSFAEFRNEVLQADLPPIMQDEDMGLVSPTVSSKGFDQIHSASNAFLVEGLNEEAASQAQSWHLNDDELSNCVHNSMTSSDCISQTFANLENNAPSSPGPKTEATNCTTNLLEEELLQDPPCEDLYYQSILSSLFKEPHQMDLGIFHDNVDRGSNFVRWRKGAKRVGECKSRTSQKMLKTILVEVPRLHERKKDCVTEEVCKQQEGNEPSSNHVLAERRRREKVNERFSALKSIIPSASKADKISILDDTISYLKELERRVQELESCQELSEYNRKNKRKPQDMEERTSDNYGSDINVGSKNKRRVRDNDEGRLDGSTDNSLAVSMVEKDVFIDIRCSWKESFFLDIIDTLGNLQLDSHSVQSSTVDGILSLTVKSRVRAGCSSLSVGVITQALQRVLKNG